MKKSIFKTIFFTGLSFISFTFGNAQERAVIFGKELGQSYTNPHTGKIQCVSYQYEQYLNELNTSNPVRKQSSEEEYQETNEVYVIPVVVHVIHSGQAVGTDKNISDARVLSQITVLNQDYRKIIGTPGNGTNPLGVDTEIEFCLAQTDPNGNPTNGINRVNLDMTWHFLNVEQTLKPQTQWDPTKYLNIWVCEFGYHSNPYYDLEDVLGYAQFPSGTGLAGLTGGTTTSNTDGVIIDWRCFGSYSPLVPGTGGTYFNGYNKGRTTTHEIGHALGLRHIWGDNYNCTVNTIDSGQDYCPDTPPHSDANYSCSGTLNSCSGYTPMPENYMDYGTDTCLNTFTANQKTRMRTTLQSGLRRATLKTSTVCSPPASTENFGLGMISLYPNPTNDVLNLVMPDNYELSGNVTIYNTVGQVIFTSKVSDTNMYRIDVSDFANGVYLVKIDRGNQSKTLQFIKR